MALADDGLSAAIEGLTLHVADVEHSLNFYMKIPGAVLLVHDPGRFAAMSIGGVLLGLLGRTRMKGFHLEIATSDLDGVYEHMRAAGIEPVGPPRQKPWKERTFEVIDPDGNGIEFQ